MNKAELVKAVEERLEGDRKTAVKAVESVVDLITRAVAKGEKVAITGFGVFEKRRRAARIARNPATGATVRVKATSVPAFRAGTNFKEVVSGKKKLERVAKTTPAKKVAAKTTAKKAVARTTVAKKAAATRTAAVAKKTTTAKKAAPRKAAAKRTR